MIWARRKTLLERLIDANFDLSVKLPSGDYKVKCSQCEVVIINGIPCHELKCLNYRKAIKDAISPYPPEIGASYVLP